MRIDVSFSISFERHRPEPEERREVQLDALVERADERADTPRIGFRAIDPDLRR